MLLKLTQNAQTNLQIGPDYKLNQQVKIIFDTKLEKKVFLELIFKFRF